MKRFEVGKKYYTRSICDHECIFEIEVISRTDKTIKAMFEGNLKTYRPYVYDNAERIKPCGTYSMCPVISCERESKKVKMQKQKEKAAEIPKVVFLNPNITPEAIKDVEKYVCQKYGNSGKENSH